MEFRYRLHIAIILRNYGFCHLRMHRGRLDSRISTESSTLSKHAIYELDIIQYLLVRVKSLLDWRLFLSCTSPWTASDGIICMTSNFIIVGRDPCSLLGIQFILLAPLAINFLVFLFQLIVGLLILLTFIFHRLLLFLFFLIDAIGKLLVFLPVGLTAKSLYNLVGVFKNCQQQLVSTWRRCTCTSSVFCHSTECRILQRIIHLGLGIALDSFACD